MNEMIPITSFTFARREKVPGSGRKPGSLNKTTALMKERLARMIEEGDETQDPLCILLLIARDPSVSPQTRADAADRLCRYLAPRLIQIDRTESETHGSPTVIIERLQALLAPVAPADAPRLAAPEQEQPE